MTKHILYKVSSVCFIILFATGCDSWLQLEPQDAITKNEYWKTKEQVNAAVIGCYASLLGTTDGQRSIPEMMFLWGEMRGDMLVPNSGALIDELEVINGNILQTNSLANWRSFYRTINNCNTVIQLAPGVLETDPTFKQAQLDAYISEMLAMRALLYFYLVRTFKEVPLKITATTSDTDPFELPKNSEEEIIQKIIDDLNEAEQKAVLTYGSQDKNKGRITRYLINALQADVHLWNQDYENCKIACDKIINSGQFGLVEGNLWFTNIFVNGNSNESIFEIQFDAQKPNTFFDMFSQGRRWLAGPVVMEELYTIDPLTGNKDLRAEDASLKADGRIWKYLGWDATRQRSVIESYAHWIVYRYADVLLMKAEAMALTGEGTGALQIIDQIRIRGNALEATEKGVSPDDVQGLLEYILEERAREFAFEGKRWFDILRNSRRDNYSRLDLLIGFAVKTAPAERQQSIINKLKDTDSHYLPIFQYELQTNKELVQNPFYLK
jgi:hypothetical protein